MRRYFDLMRQFRDDRFALFQINRRVSWFAKRLPPCKPFKEAIRNAKTPAEVYQCLDRYLAGELRGGVRELEEV
jgi:tRNA-dihydrouridine synthase